MTARVNALLIRNGIMPPTAELFHYGVKGMKWGETKSVEELKAQIAALEAAGSEPFDENNPVHVAAAVVLAFSGKKTHSPMETGVAREYIKVLGKVDQKDKKALKKATDNFNKEWGPAIKLWETGQKAQQAQQAQQRKLDRSIK